MKKVAWKIIYGRVTGHYDIQKLDKIMWQLYRDYGKIVRLGGLLGHPDLLFVFDASLVEQVFRREEHMPHRPSMPSLHHYKNVLRKDFFGDTPGVIGVWVDPVFYTQQFLWPFYSSSLNTRNYLLQLFRKALGAISQFGNYCHSSLDASEYYFGSFEWEHSFSRIN